MSDSVADVVRDRIGELRPAERKVARALLADYPRRGLETAAGLADLAGVSPPTVVRFATSLGYDGFAHLQAALLDEVGLRAQGPLGRVAKTGDVDLTEAAEVLLRGVSETIRQLPAAEWRGAVEALADPRRRVTCLGGRFTTALAQLFAVTLETIRGGVHLVADPFGADAGRLLELGTGDVLVAFDLPRYQSSTLEAVAMARKQRARVVLITDERLSPCAQYADIVLPVSVASPSALEAMTPSLVVVELLIADVLTALGPAAERRMETWESFRRRELLGPDGR